MVTVSARGRLGSINARARRHQLLPLTWNLLTNIDIQEIRDAVELIMSESNKGRPVRVPQVEAALATYAILNTGRPLWQLLPLPLVSDVSLEEAYSRAPCLFDAGDKFLWILRSAAPRKAPSVEHIREEEAYKRSEFIAVPAIPQIALMIRRLRDLRRVTGRSRTRLFAASGEGLRRNIEHLLRHRRCATGILISKSAKLGTTKGCRTHPRRASCTVEALERWLTAAISHEPGGDIGLAAAVTDSQIPISRSVSHYCNISGAHARTIARKITQPFFDASWVPEPAIPFRSERTGGSFDPKDEVVRNLAAAIAADFETCADDPVARHAAITNYTVALVCFATGHRGKTSLLPSSRAIDDADGFCVIHDKDRRRSAEARLSWVAPVARQQISAYERHLDELRSHLSEQDFGDLWKFQSRAPDVLPLFNLTEGGMTWLSPEDTWRRLSKYNWYLPPNAPRHWLRIRLVGHCSTETLHAFFGHWQVGTHPWWRTSCLDPVTYVTDLERAIPTVLEQAGWKCLDFPQQPKVMRPPSGTTSRTTKAPHQFRFFRTCLGQETRYPPSLGNADKHLDAHSSSDPHFRMGQLLFSAVLNGGLLNEGDWLPWIRSVANFDPTQRFPWLELTPDDERETFGPQRRWFPDPSTRSLLAHWHSRPPTKLSIGPDTPDRCLVPFIRHARGDIRRAKEDLLRFAEYKWALRLPPLLLEFALGRVSSFPIRENDWRRLLGLAGQPSKAASSSRQKDYFTPLMTLLPAENAILYGPWEDYRQGRIGLLRAKRASAERLVSLLEGTSSPGRKLLIEWCAAMLRAKRKRPQRTGYAHYTVRDYLSRVVTELFEEDIDSLKLNISVEDVESRLENARSQIHHDEDREKLNTATRSFIRYITARTTRKDGVKLDESNDVFLDDAGSERADLNQEDPDRWGERPVETDPKKVYANLIAPDEYARALASCRRLPTDADDFVLALILGYRAGLRIREILGLRASDFVRRGALLELHVQRHETRELKTFQSRRIIPLDVLLEDDELRFLIARLEPVWHHSRSGFDPYLLGPLGAKVPKPWPDFETSLSKELTRVCGRTAVFHHLRHSFASYLLATLLLPSSVAPSDIPSRLRSAISPERQQRVKARFLAGERLGQSALHAVSQVVGHAGVDMTLGTYVHLLDLSLHLYVSRDVTVTTSRTADQQHFSSSAAGISARPPSEYRAPMVSYSEPPSNVPDFRRLARDRTTRRTEPDVTKILSPMCSPLGDAGENHQAEWRVIHDILTATSGSERRELARAYGIPMERIHFWRKRFELVLDNCVKQKPTGRSLPRPDGVDAQNLVTRLWVALRSDLVPGEERLIEQFIAGYDRKRAIARFPTARDASHFKAILKRSGLKSSDVVFLSSARYRELEVGTAQARGGRTGILARYWLFSEKDLEWHEQRLLEDELRDGDIRTCLSLTVGSQWPSRRYGSVERRPHAPVRQLNYAVRFTLLLLAIEKGLRIGERRAALQPRSKAA